MVKKQASKADKIVFISYRRSSSAYIARSIFENLKSHRFKPYMDTQSLESGPFDTQLLKLIEQSCHFLVVLTPDTLDRCVEPDDWVRREIEHALDFKLNIVPVYANGFDINKQNLSGKLAELKRFNGTPPLFSPELFPSVMQDIRTRYLKSDKCRQVVSGNLEPFEQYSQLNTLQLEIFPNNPTSETYLDHGLSLYFEKHDRLAALEYFNKAIELNPEFAAAYNNRGVMMLADKQFEKALDDFQQAIHYKSDYVEAYNNRGLVRLEMKDKDLDGAISDFTEAIRLNFNPIILMNRGNSYTEKLEYEKAHSDYLTALRINPQFAFAYNNLGNLFYQIGRYDLAHQNYDLAIQVSPDLAEAHRGKGIAFMRSGDYEKAHTEFNLALDTNANDWKTYGSKADLARLQKDWNEGVINYSKAIELNSQVKNLFLNRARCYFYLRKYLEVLEDCDKAEMISIDAKDIDILMVRGFALEESGKNLSAIEVYNEILRIDSQSVVALVHIGILYHKQFSFMKAIQYYNSAFKISPNDAEIYNLRALSYLSLSDFEHALQDFDEAIKLDPANALLYSNRGEAYLNKDDSESASNNFEFAIQLDPNLEFGLAGLAITKNVLGKEQEAKQIWNDLVRKNPNFNNLRYVKETLNWSDRIISFAQSLIE